MVAVVVGKQGEEIDTGQGNREQTWEGQAGREGGAGILGAEGEGQSLEEIQDPREGWGDSSGVRE